MKNSIFLFHFQNKDGFPTYTFSTFEAKRYKNYQQNLTAKSFPPTEKYSSTKSKNNADFLES